MYPTRVIARGFKRGSFDVALSRANVITGDNFAGKTQILDAVRLALISYLPELGKRPADTFELASGKEMAVELHFDTGDIIVHEFWLEGNSVKQERTVPDSLKDCNLLTVMLNAEAYFELGAIDRTRYVFANCPVDVLSREEIAERVNKVAADYDMAQVFDALDVEIAADETTANAWTPQMELDFILSHVATHWKNLQATEKMHQGTINGITTQRADEEAGLPLATLQDMKAALTRSITEINDRRGRFIGSFTQMKADANRRAVIDREIQHGHNAREQLVGLKAKLALFDDQIAKLTPVTAQMVSASVEKGAGFRALIDTFTSGLRTANGDLGNAEKELDGLSAASCCPYCRAAGETWKQAKQIELMATISRLKSTGGEIAAKLTAARNDFDLAVIDHKNLIAELTRQTTLRNERGSVVASIAALEPVLVRFQTLEEEKARLMADDPALTTQVEAIQTELNVATGELRGLDAAIEKAAGRANDLMRMATAEKERDATAKMKELAAAAGKELKAIQAEMVEGAFRPLLQTANAIFTGVLPFAIEYKDGEIGARAGGLWRGHKTMSGVERALTYCAIQMALASRAPVKVAILDEMTKLVSKRVPAFAAQILEAVEAGLVDQVLVIDPERGDLYRRPPLVPDSTDLAFNVIVVE